MSKTNNLYKRQYRLFDVYRYLATGEKSKIMGIQDYTVFNDVLVTTIVTKQLVKTDIHDLLETVSEKAIKQHIKQVNAMLKNCHKPGPKTRCNK